MSAHSDGPGRGSEFTVRLPASAHRGRHACDGGTVRRPGARRGRAASSAFSSSTTTATAREMIAKLLTGAGHEVQVANDPSQALSLADDFRPQIAILDIGLPVMDGYTLGRELRARLADAPPILIALTATGRTRTERAARKRASPSIW